MTRVEKKRLQAAVKAQCGAPLLLAPKLHIGDERACLAEEATE